jgi:hypothetical protein
LDLSSPGFWHYFGGFVDAKREALLTHVHPEQRALVGLLLDHVVELILLDRNRTIDVQQTIFRRLDANRSRIHEVEHQAGLMSDRIGKIEDILEDPQGSIQQMALSLYEMALKLERMASDDNRTIGPRLADQEYGSNGTDSFDSNSGDATTGKG